MTVFMHRPRNSQYFHISYIAAVALILASCGLNTSSEDERTTASTPSEASSNNIAAGAFITQDDSGVSFSLAIPDNDAAGVLDGDDKSTIAPYEPATSPHDKPVPQSRVRIQCKAKPYGGYPAAISKVRAPIRAYVTIELKELSNNNITEGLRFAYNCDSAGAAIRINQLEANKKYQVAVVIADLKGVATHKGVTDPFTFTPGGNKVRLAMKKVEPSPPSHGSVDIDMVFEEGDQPDICAAKDLGKVKKCPALEAPVTCRAVLHNRNRHRTVSYTFGNECLAESGIKTRACADFPGWKVVKTMCQRAQTE